MFSSWRVAATALCLISFVAAAGAETLIVVNQTDSYVTVSVDGAYGCNTAGGTTCRIPVSAGRHAVRAVRTDTGRSISRTIDVPVGGATRWTLYTVWE